jgi:hypothetical protein
MPKHNRSPTAPAANETKYLAKFRCRFKGIGSILFLKNGLKKICRKNYKNYLRSNNYEVCTAVALCFQNIFDVRKPDRLSFGKVKKY